MKEPTIAEIEANPWTYAIWVLLKTDEAIRDAKALRDELRAERNKLAKTRRK